ncbi:hypothetical protein M2451_002354 [Dysgonomonas sp. PFB1-18]|uniref:M56 family metallopeptidase n=1 Tax=unclassified Dysgonomonas TaxID=2630389 RepID=UPI0024743D55|nr:MULTISPECIES: M56 family metallopeptidase [unclassified Dysgonomonas]MDH6307120.1 hypothetical protein [Dysgonomonas sp. PF1-14]MDH6337039.1 hypothetical protein [Dysgonomonas sp. PF1-16]MDH6381025.1 hypothetical protein [Dysgonomonas sp. PFB1-18]MDH6396396.1 hypothetical protein [Dysgonomonas sp. PF1-23]
MLIQRKGIIPCEPLFLVVIPLLSLIFSLTTIETENGIAGFSISGLFENKSEINNNLAANYTAAFNYDAPAIEEQAITAPPALYPYPGSEIISGKNHDYTIPVVVMIVYLLVSLTLAASIIRQMLRIRKVCAEEPLRYVGNVPVYSSNNVQSSFSVMKKIYVRNNIADEKLNLIIQHEYQHIISRHYIDLIILEIMSVLLWFNPVVWLIRKELRAVHEFEADTKLLHSGIKAREYMIAILEETTGRIPSLANGLRGSLIKKRFINMKNENRVRFRALRVALTVPFIVILLIFFSCKQAEKGVTAQYEEQYKSKLVNVENVGDRLLYEVRNSNGEYELFWSDELAEKVKDMASFRIKGLPPVRMINVDHEGNYIKDATDDYPIYANNLEEGFDYARHNVILAADGSWINPDGVALVDWTRSCGVKYNAKAITNKRIWVKEKYLQQPRRILRVEANDKETKITLATTSYSNWVWRFTDKNTCLIDKSTGDRYMIRDIEGDEEVGRLSILEGTDRKWFEATYIFPPLKKGVEMVDYYSPFNNVDAPEDYNGTEAYIPDIKVKNSYQGEIIR